MKRSSNFLIAGLALAAALAFARNSYGETVITTFQDFNLNGVFANWITGFINSTPTNYQITAAGYGSGYKDINPNLDASGETTIQVALTVSGTNGPAGPVSGPIVSLVDGDGTFFNFAWYGQINGHHVLTASLSSPTWISSPGTTPGLNLANLDFFHLQDDPGTYQGTYTIIWEDLRLIGAPPPIITGKSYDPTTHQFTLTWSSKANMLYTVLYSGSVTTAFTPLQTDIPSDGPSTTTTVTVPDASAGYLRIKQQE